MWRYPLGHCTDIEGHAQGLCGHEHHKPDRGKDYLKNLFSLTTFSYTDTKLLTPYSGRAKLHLAVSCERNALEYLLPTLHTTLEVELEQGAATAVLNIIFNTNVHLIVVLL